MSLDALEIRRVLGRKTWRSPMPWGPDGWAYRRIDGEGSVIVSLLVEESTEWIHASIAYTMRLPNYHDLWTLHRAVWRGRGYAYQVFVPNERHVNIHENALHLWGRADGAPAMPEFSSVIAGIRTI